MAAEPKTGPSAASARALAARLASNHAGVIAWLRTAIRNSETGSLLVEWVRTGTLPDEFEVSGVGRGEASDCIMIMTERFADIVSPLSPLVSGKIRDKLAHLGQTYLLEFDSSDPKGKPLDGHNSEPLQVQSGQWPETRLVRG